MPFTKYFCTNGYTSKIGIVATIVIAILIDSGLEPLIEEILES